MTQRTTVFEEGVSQARSGDPRPLGELWIDAGWMTRAQLDKLLAVQREVLAKQSGQAAAPLIAPKPASSPVDLEQTANGVLTGGDVLTIDGEAYTVVGGPFLPDELDDTKLPNVVITPGLLAATTDGQAVTVTTNPNRGEAAARTLIIVTKD